MSLSALLLETLFTKVFSVTLWSQFAFMAVSVALLGLTVGALLVYSLPIFKKQASLSRQLVTSAMLFVATIPLSLALHLIIPTQNLSGWTGALYFAAEFLALTLPFLFSGINVTLVLIRFGGDFRRLYALDLLGAALGCILFIGVAQTMNELQGILAAMLFGLLSAGIYARDFANWRKGLVITLLILFGGWASDLIWDWAGSDFLMAADEASLTLPVEGLDLGARGREILNTLLALSLATVALFVAGPYLLRQKPFPRQRDFLFLGYFGLIGVGFMLIEISALQYLTAFLGDPGFSISVVLCSLLLATGLGSFLARRGPRQTGVRRLGLLLLILTLTGFATVEGVDYGIQSDAGLGLRLLLAAGLLFPMGVAMGMAMPLGMDLSNQERNDLNPWFWSVNGAASVFGSVLAVVLAVGFNLEVPFWAGVASYGLAVMVYGLLVRNPAK